jgi:phage gp46-like protein
MSFVDITLEQNERTYFDIDFENSDLKTTQGFATALKISLMAERRASVSEIPAPEKRRGWWGNEAAGFGEFEIGSKLWLLNQARTTQLTLNNAITFSNNGLQWFIDDNYLDKVQVRTAYDQTKALLLHVDLIRGQDIVFSIGFKLWQNTFEELFN